MNITTKTTTEFIFNNFFVQRLHAEQGASLSNLITELCMLDKDRTRVGPHLTTHREMGRQRDLIVT